MVICRSCPCKGEPGSQSLLQTAPFNESLAALSPDGRWVAYQGNGPAQTAVFVRPFPNADDGRWQVSTDGGTDPRWAPDGGELFYRDADRMMVVSVENRAHVLRRSSQGALRGELRQPYKCGPELRRVTGWSAFPHAEGRRAVGTGNRGHATHRRRKLVRGTQPPRTPIPMSFVSGLKRRKSLQL